MNTTTQPTPVFIPIALYAAREAANSAHRYAEGAQKRTDEAERGYGTAYDDIAKHITATQRAIVLEMRRAAGEATEAAIDAEYIPDQAERHHKRAKAAQDYADKLAQQIIQLDTAIWQLHHITSYDRPR